MKVDLRMIMDILTVCIGLGKSVAGYCHETCAVPQQLMVPWLVWTGVIVRDHLQQGVRARGRNLEAPSSKRVVRT